MIEGNQSIEKGNRLDFNGSILVKINGKKSIKFSSKKQAPELTIAEQLGLDPKGSYDHYYQVIKTLYMMYRSHNEDRKIEWGKTSMAFIQMCEINLAACNQKSLGKLLDSSTQNFIADVTGMLIAKLSHQSGRPKKHGKANDEKKIDTQVYNLVELIRSLLLDLENEFTFKNQGKVPTNYMEFRKGAHLFKIVSQNKILAKKTDMWKYFEEFKRVHAEHIESCSKPEHRSKTFRDIQQKYLLFYNAPIFTMSALITFISLQLQNPRNLTITMSQSPFTENQCDIYYIFQKEFISIFSKNYFPQGRINSYDIEYMFKSWQQNGYVIPYSLKSKKIFYSPQVSNYLLANRNSIQHSVRKLLGCITQIFDFFSHLDIKGVVGMHDDQSGFLLFSFYRSVLTKWQETYGIDIDFHLINLDQWYTLGPDIVTLRFKKYELENWINLKKLISFGLLTIGDRQQGYYVTQRGLELLSLLNDYYSLISNIIEELFEVEISENQKINLPETQQQCLPYDMRSFIQNRFNPSNYICSLHKSIFLNGKGYFHHLARTNFSSHEGLVCHVHENPIILRSVGGFYKHLLRVHLNLKNLTIAKINRICFIINKLSSEVYLDFKEIELILRKCDALFGVFEEIGLRQTDWMKSDIQEVYLFYMACLAIDPEKIPNKLVGFDNIDYLLSEYLSNLYTKFEFGRIIKRYRKCKQKSISRQSTEIIRYIDNNID